MKRIFFISAVLAAMVSCSRENIPSGLPGESGDGVMSFSISVGRGAATKGLKDDWDSGDAVFVFFKGIASKYMKMTYDGTEWSDAFPAGDFLESDFSGIVSDDRRMTAVHFPFPDIDVSYSGDRFSFFRGGELLYSYYMYVTSDYTVSGTEVEGALNMEKPDKFVQFHVPGEAENVGLYHFMESHLTPKACSAVTLSGAVEESSLVTGHPLKGFAYKGGVIFSGFLETAGVSADYEFQLVKDFSASKAYAEFTYTLSGNRTIANNATMMFPAVSSWTKNYWVDLGLSVRWGTQNIGAASPDDAGGYFAWGETETKTTYSWETYKHCDGTKFTQKKYNNNSTYGIVDGKTVLDAEDDAAYVTYGGKYRIGTQAEWEELRSCSSEWKSYANKGRLVKSSKYAGLAIFLPAVGTKPSLNSNGNYWRRDRGGNTNAYYDWFSDTSWSGSYYDKYYGMSIRAVCDF